MYIFAVRKRKGCGKCEWPVVGREWGGGMPRHVVGGNRDKGHTVSGAGKKRGTIAEYMKHSTVVVVGNEAIADEHDVQHLHQFNLYVRISKWWG